MTQTWSRDELEQAASHYVATIATCLRTGDWEPFVQLFTEDVEYTDPLSGVMRGHEAVRTWASSALAPFPGSAFTYPEAWRLVDEQAGRVVLQIDDALRDPGDGSIHCVPHVGVLLYAGDLRFRRAHDFYDVASFIRMIEDWGRRSAGLGTLSEEETAWFAATMPAALEGLVNA